jgi:hypothetical protein
MHGFFNRSPDDVAIDLRDKTLKVGDCEAAITKAKAQYPADNKNWGDRPLFTSKSVGAYVAPYRGSYMLFLKTNGAPGTNTCVRIDGIKIGEQLYSSPAQVCKALGINSERTGKVHFAKGVVSVSFPL